MAKPPFAERLAPYEHLWTENPTSFVVVRQRLAEDLVLDEIYDWSGAPYYIPEGRVKKTVIKQMVQAGTEIVETNAPVETVEWEFKNEGNRRIQSELLDEDLGSMCLFRLVTRPSFELWHSWRLFKSYHSAEELAAGVTPSYMARRLGWRLEGTLTFRERVRLPRAEQGWKQVWLTRGRPAGERLWG